MAAREELIATPAARDEALAALQEHFARDHLEVADFERRVEMAERARTRRELDEALAGLPSLEAALARPGRLTTTLRAVLSASRRSGAWRSPSLVRVEAWGGSLEVDFSTAVLGPGTTEVEVRAVLGTVRLVVPEGLRVDVQGRALLGAFPHHAQEPASQRDARALRVRGSAFLGSVEIIVRRRQGLLAGIRAFLTGG